MRDLLLSIVADVNRKFSKPYSLEYARMAASMVKVYGASDAELYRHFDVDKMTFRKWIIEYPELRDAIQQARDEVNSELVERSLLKRAIGYEAEEHEESINAKGTIKTTKKKVHIPGDVAAQKFFLEKRSSRRWPAKKEEGGEGHKTFVAILNQISANNVPLAHVHAKRTVAIGGDSEGTQARPVLPGDTI